MSNNNQPPEQRPVNSKTITNYPGTYYAYPANPGFLQTKPSKEELENLKISEFEKVVPAPSGGAWQSVQIRPKATFATQNPGEKIYILARRHWITNIGWVTRNFIYSLLPFLLLLVLDLFNVKLPMDAEAQRLYFVLILAFYSLIFTNVIRDFFDWYFDPYIITNERILDFTFNPFTNYTAEEAPLENIETVKQNTKGIIGALFNYGDIIVSTEAFSTVITFEAAANPSRVRDIVSDLAKIARTYSYGD